MESTKSVQARNKISNIKKNLKEIMIHYKKHEQNNSLLTFQEKFAIENALCTIENDSINFNFWGNNIQGLVTHHVMHKHTQPKELASIIYGL